MEALGKTCSIYVDYEGLLVGLSYNRYLDVDALLVDLLQKACQAYRVQSATAIGTWLHQASREQLIEQGYVCQAVFGSERDVMRALQVQITENLEPGTVKAADVFILVGGRANRAELLQQLRLAQKTTLLWTLEPPSPAECALCSAWEQISYPANLEHWTWPRQILLQSLVLMANTLHGDTQTTFSLPALCDLLNRLQPFNKQANHWLTIAIRERAVLLQRSGPYEDQLTGTLNRQHSVVQQAFFMRERVLMTLNAMISRHDWVALSALEKALATTGALTYNQEYYHAWLELLVNTGVLLTRVIPHSAGPFIVTTFSFSPDYQVIAILREQEKRNLQRFIIVASNFSVRRGQQAIKRTSLATLLIKTMTTIEAQATLRGAMEQEIAHSGPASRRPSSATTCIWLNRTHPLVQITLNQCNQLILLSYTILTSCNGQVSESVLAEKLSTSGQGDAGETLFWICLLIDEGLLVRENASAMLRMKCQDAVIKQVLNTLN